MPQRGTDPSDAPSGRERAHQELDREAEEVTAAVLAASRLFVAISARALDATASALTLPQLRALVVLDTQGPVKLAALAATLDVNPSTALRMVERLEALHLVDRRTNPANRREVVLSLTSPGHELVGRVLAHRRREIRGLVERLPDGERTALVAALRALTAVAGEIGLDPSQDVGLIGGLVDEPLDPASPGAPGDARHGLGS
ncbi:MarR family winged helix-turn-helix transcriptional regulator [Streptomyces sp. NPDC048415]|jgi:DNA-binding MarR family transcriptional regulator|uniref:MarR family winged helix-turn-helix transcriptional regulator n=1 Tax=Streptomyces sp. NPDC048415 TaxID=3154822 RepID=UPI003445E91B